MRIPEEKGLFPAFSGLLEMGGKDRKRAQQAGKGRFYEEGRPETPSTPFYFTPIRGNPR